MKKECKQLLQGNLDKYKSIPFWSWNSHLEEKVLVKQIEEMYAAGIGGFIMHARTGLQDEYLGEKWFSCIDACLKKARELNMEAWIYDENGWPSGFVGGKLLEVEKYRARFLEYSVGEWEEGVYAVFIEDEKKGFQRVPAPVQGVETYHKVYLRISPANSDILSPEVVDAFIEETHEKYYQRFQGSFGRELAGFFTDEPQYYRWATPYTPWAEPIFKANGEDIRDGLIWLFVHDERGYAFRTKYYGTLSELYVENFYKKLYDWCENHGCKLTGHSVEEPSLYTQMWGGAAVSPSYEYEHIPGIDALGRWTVPELASKQVASVSAQLGKKQILTETYGCSGNDVTPKELKQIGQSQYMQGVNKMCQHLYPYSIVGQGKVDHPPVFGPHGNWGESFKAFNDYFTRFGAVICNTDEVVDIAVLHPMRDIWLEYVRGEDYSSIVNIEEAFKALQVELRKHGVTYHLVDERILRRHGKVEGNTLRVGERVYDVLLVPKMHSMAKSSYEILKQYTGKLCVLDVPQYLDGERANISLSSNTALEEIIKNAEIGYLCEDGKSMLTHRKGEIGEFLFIQNVDKSPSTVRLTGVAEEYCALDFETLTETPVSNLIRLEGDEGIVLCKGQGGGQVCVEKKTAHTDSFRVTDISDNYLVMDYGQIAKKGQPFGKKYPLYGLMEALLREDYKGEISVRQTFTLDEKMPLKLMLEKAKLTGATVNGRDIRFTQSEFDVNFVEADIGEYCKVGENEFIYSFEFWQHDGVHFALFDPLATESLRNCLYYDTSIETSYLLGDFVVGEDRVLSKRKALPAMNTQLHKNGYPFFKGILTVEGKVPYDGEGKVILALDGRFMAAEVYANGKKETLALDNKKEITHLLKKGENEVKILLRSSLRNLFGPHHFKPDPEPFGVSPFAFTLRGRWKEGYPAEYTDEYFTVPFGVDGIYCISSK